MLSFEMMLNSRLYGSRVIPRIIPCLILKVGEANKRQKNASLFFKPDFKIGYREWSMKGKPK